MRSAYKTLAAILTAISCWTLQAQFTTTADLRSPVQPGSIVTNGPASYTVIGGGDELWGDSDQGFVALYSQTGDFDVRVRAESLTPANRWTKAGIMLREDLNITSEAIFTYVSPADVPTPAGGNGVNTHSTGWRTGTPTTDNPTGGRNEIASGNPAYPNAWIRMTRVGNTVTTLRSADGFGWTPIVAFDMNNTTVPATAFAHPIPSTALLGFGVSSHNNDINLPTATAQFRDFGSPSNAVLITRQPSSRTNVVGQTSTFSFGHAGGFDFLSMQWRSNGVPIAGATGPTHTTPALTLAHSGQTYDVVISNPVNGSSATSSAGTLTVVEAPQISAATTRNDPNGIYITFTRQMDGTTVLNPANYSVNNGVTVSGVSFVGSGSNTVRVAVSALAAATTYTVAIANVQDFAGSAIFPNPADVDG